MKSILSPVIFRVFILVTLLFSQVAFAENLVLIQGYLGGPENWRDSGITAILRKGGWVNGGYLHLGRYGVDNNVAQVSGDRRYFTLDLPTKAPLLAQSKHLARYLTYLHSKYPDTVLILVGHSAGGVLARLYMVQHPKTAVAALITIASPHRGTESAELGLMAGQSPLSWMDSMLGIDTLNHSQGLYYDLMRENPNNLLGWLNYQRHPNSQYVSIVRSEDNETFGFGNLIVPAWSQDMNQVFALRGRVRTINMQGGHGLRAEDGRLLLRILNSLNRT